MKKHEKKILILTTILLIFILIFAIKYPFLKNPEKYSYTKAICDEKNYCEDYLIECEGKNLNKLTPTGFAIEQNEAWKDNREQKELCE